MKQSHTGPSILGARLRQLRESFGLVLQDVANLFSTNRNVPSQWESGAREPSYEHLVRLADFYGVTVDWLLGREHAEKDSARVKRVKSQLHDFLRLREEALTSTPPGVRVRTAAEFLSTQDPTMFSMDRIARQVLIDPDVFREMVYGQAMVTGPVIQRFAEFVNLEEVWFYKPVPQLEDPFIKYRTLVEKFQADGLTPEYVEGKVWGSPRASRRGRKGAEG